MTVKRQRKLKPASLSQRALEAENAKLGKLLDAQIEQNNHLYDRLELALNGGRPPPGTLTVLAALEPFARFAETLSIAQSNDEIAVAFCLPHKPSTYRQITYRHLRDAARTLAWWRDSQKVAKSGKGK